MMPRPLSLLCELTYRCNLQCPYCYNPLRLRDYADELSTQLWESVLAQAADAGVVQVHFSGGEPTLRRDLPELVSAASRLELYTNLITQGTFLDDVLLDRLLACGTRPRADFDTSAGGRGRRSHRRRRSCTKKSWRCWNAFAGATLR